MKCPHCQLNLKTIETRTETKWIRRAKICKNGHKVTTRQLFGQIESIVPRRNGEQSVKRNMSSVSPSLGVGSILRMWAGSGEPQAEPTLSE